MYTTEIPGLPGGPVATTFPVRIQLCPAWRTFNRPGIKAHWPRRNVQHGDGNPNGTAAMEANYVGNGAGGRQVSFHMAIDTKECVIIVPLDEVTWQAADGAGPGNMNGVSCEQIESTVIWNRRAWFEKLVAMTAEIMGIIAARLNIAKPEYHWTFNYMDPDRHHCPQQMMFIHTEQKPRYERLWFAAKSDELKRMGGEPVPVPDDGEPVHPGDIVTTTANLHVRRGYGLNYPVIATLPAGTDAQVGADGDGRYMVDADGYTWWNIAFEEDSGWAACDWLDITKRAVPDTPESPAVTYAKPLVVDALYDTDLAKYDTAPGVVADKDGTDWIFVADVVEATTDTPRLQYAASNAPSIGANVRKGDRFVVAWIVKAADGEWYYLTPWWSRIRYADTKRVSDAPLLSEGNPKSAVKPSQSLAQVMASIA